MRPFTHDFTAVSSATNTVWRKSIPLLRLIATYISQLYMWEYKYKYPHHSRISTQTVSIQRCVESWSSYGKPTKICTARTSCAHGSDDKSVLLMCGAKTKQDSWWIWSTLYTNVCTLLKVHGEQEQSSEALLSAWHNSQLYAIFICILYRRLS